MISDAIIRRVKYPPELIPDSWYGQVPLNGESTPPVLDLKRFSPYIAILCNMQALRSANVNTRARYDGFGDVRVEQNNGAILRDATAAADFVGAWWLPAKSILYYNFFGVALMNNYPTHYGVWAFTPTIAHKLRYNLTLTSTELAICNELGIKNTVEKGLLPLPISQQIEREYYILGEETHTRNINIAAINTIYTLENIYPKPNDEFIVLTRVAAAPAGPANTIHIYIDRDDDANFADVVTFPLSLNAGGEIACFIPATREIRLTIEQTAGVAVAGHLFRYTFKRIKLTNLLKVRFGLITEDELPAEAKDVWKKVLGGIL
ncbi:hypothetical protein ES707_03671 [subsurface metagenome]